MAVSKHNSLLTAIFCPYSSLMTVIKQNSSLSAIFRLLHPYRSSSTSNSFIMSSICISKSEIVHAALMRRGDTMNHFEVQTVNKEHNSSILSKRKIILPITKKYGWMMLLLAHLQLLLLIRWQFFSVRKKKGGIWKEDKNF